MNFKEVADGKQYQIIREHILQTDGSVTAFYERAKIIDLRTGEEEYINEEIVDLFFPLYDEYNIGQMKRAGVYSVGVDKEDA